VTEVVSSQSGTDSDAPEGFGDVLGQRRPSQGTDPTRKPSQGTDPTRRPSYGAPVEGTWTPVQGPRKGSMDPVEGTFAGKPNLKHASPGKNRKGLTPSVSSIIVR